MELDYDKATIRLEEHGCLAYCETPLTEELWLTNSSTDAAGWMIRRIWEDTPNPSPRKSRLFVCNCARPCWKLLQDNRLKKGIEIAEEYAHGLASRCELDTALRGLAGAFRKIADRSDPGFDACFIVAIAVSPSNDRDGKAADLLSAIDARGRLPGQLTACRGERHPEKWVRDIFGNPFRPITLNPSWQTRTVVALAQAIYEERAFDRLPILADALEDAGCNNEDILNHCRQPGEHVKGCFVVDLLLDKK